MAEEPVLMETVPGPQGSSQKSLRGFGKPSKYTAMLNLEGFQLAKQTVAGISPRKEAGCSWQ